jgi:hypothetical protein
MFKTTIQIPIGSESGQCTIELPLKAFSDGKSDDESEERIAALSSKVTVSVLKIAREMAAAQKSHKRGPDEDASAPTSPLQAVKKPRMHADLVEAAKQNAIAESPRKTPDMSKVINIDLSGHDRTITVRMHRTTQLLAALVEFCGRNGRAPNTMRIYYQDVRVDWSETPDSVSLTFVFSLVEIRRS